MNDFKIVENYMNTKYSGKPYAMRQGNACIWVSMGLCEMYFILRDSKIVDIQVD